MTVTDALLLAGYLCLLLLSLRWRGRSLHGPWAVLLRSFLPSWHFFDQPGHRPLLQIQIAGPCAACDLEAEGNTAQRTASADGHAPESAWQSWRSWTAKSRPSFGRVFHNPFTLAQLYQQTLVEQLTRELARDDLGSAQLVHSAAYRSVLALSASLAEDERPDWQAFRFRILLLDPLAGQTPPVTALSVDDERLILLSPPIRPHDLPMGVQRNRGGRKDQPLGIQGN